MTFSKVRAIEISEERVGRIRQELLKSMEVYSVIRRVLRPIKLRAHPARAEMKGEFRKIGVNEITDKIWFVEGSFPEGQYATAGMGTSYALEIAKTEAVYLMGSISRASGKAEHEIRYSDELTPNVIYDAANLLTRQGFDPNLVLTNVRDHVYLWRFHPPYGGFGRDTHLDMPGHKPLIVDFDPEIPQGSSYVLDRTQFGSLVLKQDLDLTVSEISDEEKPMIIKHLPELKGHDLGEKVRLVIQEILRIDIDSPKAIIPIRKVNG